MQELHLSWDCSEPGFDTAAFSQLGSGFPRLQILSLDVTAAENYGQMGVSLVGLAGTLEVLRLSVDAPNDGLLLSLTQCSKVSRSLKV